jgi:hypothetical protein
MDGIAMGVRQKFDRKIREKQIEIDELVLKVREAKAYLQALQDASKFLPREGGAEDDEGDETPHSVKPGTALELVVKTLRSRGKPMHIMEILPAIGRKATPEDRASIGSTISAYVRRQQVFTRPGPNTFGLLEWGTEANSIQESGPPEDFGLNS